MITSTVLGPGVLGHATPPTTAGVGALGPVGKCPVTPTLFIAIGDDSGSITAPGGADPISNRYGEVKLAMQAVAKRCGCKKEWAAVLHFDTPGGDAGPNQLSKAGLQRLSAGLGAPHGGSGSSNLLPSITKARELAEARVDHEVVVAILSDFMLTDGDLNAVTSALETFPGTVIACVLGTAPAAPVPGADQTIHVGFDAMPGAVGRAVLAGLTLHRLSSAGPDATPSRRGFHNGATGVLGRLRPHLPTSVPRGRLGRRAGRRTDRRGDGPLRPNDAQ